LLERPPFLAGGRLAVPPETVAGVVQPGATAADPNPRYPVGTRARLLNATGTLPDGVLDLVSQGLLTIGTALGDSDG
jgi:hypothetical protein